MLKRCQSNIESGYSSFPKIRGEHSYSEEVHQKIPAYKTLSRANSSKILNRHKDINNKRLSPLPNFYHNDQMDSSSQPKVENKAQTEKINLHDWITFCESNAIIKSYTPSLSSFSMGNDESSDTKYDTSLSTNLKTFRDANCNDSTYYSKIDNIKAVYDDVTTPNTVANSPIVTRCDSKAITKRILLEPMTISPPKSTITNVNKVSHEESDEDVDQSSTPQNKAAALRMKTPYHMKMSTLTYHK